MQRNLVYLSLLVVTLFALTACGGSDQPAKQLAIQGLDIKFNLNTLEAKVGQLVELTYENKGSIDHAFKIDGIAKEVKIRPGQSYVLKFRVNEAGSYKYICAMPGHEMAGMVGTLNVTAAVDAVAAR